MCQPGTEFTTLINCTFTAVGGKVRAIYENGADVTARAVFAADGTSCVAKLRSDMASIGIAMSASGGAGGCASRGLSVYCDADAYIPMLQFARWASTTTAGSQQVPPIEAGGLSWAQPGFVGGSRWSAPTASSAAGPTAFTWTKVRLKHCNAASQKHTRSYTTLASAQAACRGLGRACSGVYDNSCDGKNTFFACREGITFSKSSASCIYTPSSPAQPMMCAAANGGQSEWWLRFPAAADARALPASPCTPCAPGQYSAHHSNRSCVGTRCAAGKFGASRQTSAAAALCTPCPAGAYSSSSGSGGCTPCPPGQYSGAAGSASCTGRSCTPGRFGPQNQTSAAAALCAPCAAGKHQGASGLDRCRSCPAGKVPTATSGATSCGCAPGTFDNPGRSGECSKCPSGKYRNGSPAPTTDCRRRRRYRFCSSTPCSGSECPAGKFGLRGQVDAAAAACTPCPAGAYSSSYGSGGCTPCPSGTYSGAAGSALCTGRSCTPGRFGPQNQTSAAAALCAPCAAGKHQGASGLDHCLSCPAGKAPTATSGATSCGCAPGTFDYSSGECSECPSGKHRDGNPKPDCRRRRRYRSCSSSSTPCSGSGCPAGKFGKRGQVDAAAAACKACPLGKFQSELGQPVCGTCLSGRAPPQVQGARACLSPPGLHPGETAAVPGRLLPAQNASQNGAFGTNGPQRCLDGSTSTPCSFGSTGTRARFTVDLGRAQNISSVSIDGGAAIGSHTLQLSIDGTNWVVCGAYIVRSNSRTHEVCAGAARYVMIECEQDGQVSMTEVNVFAPTDVACPAGTYRGSYGNDCLGSPCPPGRFGTNGQLTAAAAGCKLCPAGRHSPGSGSIACAGCHVNVPAGSSTCCRWGYAGMVQGRRRRVSGEVLKEFVLITAQQGCEHAVVDSSECRRAAPIVTAAAGYDRRRRRNDRRRREYKPRRRRSHTPAPTPNPTPALSMTAAAMREPPHALSLGDRPRGCFVNTMRITGLQTDSLLLNNYAKGCSDEGGSTCKPTSAAHICYNCAAPPTENDYGVVLAIPALLLFSCSSIFIPRTEPNRREFTKRLDVWIANEGVLVVVLLLFLLRADGVTADFHGGLLVIPLGLCLMYWLARFVQWTRNDPPPAGSARAFTAFTMLSLALLIAMLAMIAAGASPQQWAQLLMLIFAAVAFGCFSLVCGIPGCGGKLCASITFTLLLVAFGFLCGMIKGKVTHTGLGSGPSCAWTTCALIPLWVLIGVLTLVSSGWLIFVCVDGHSVATKTGAILGTFFAFTCLATMIMLLTRSTPIHHLQGEAVTFWRLWTAVTIAEPFFVAMIAMCAARLYATCVVLVRDASLIKARLQQQRAEIEARAEVRVQQQQPIVQEGARAAAAVVPLRRQNSLIRLKNRMGGAVSRSGRAVVSSLRRSVRDIEAAREAVVPRALVPAALEQQCKFCEAAPDAAALVRRLTTLHELLQERSEWLHDSARTRVKAIYERYTGSAAEVQHPEWTSAAAQVMGKSLRLFHPLHALRRRMLHHVGSRLFNPSGPAEAEPALTMTPAANGAVV